MKEKIIKVVKYIFFLCLGIGLMLYASKGMNFDELMVEASKMNFSFFIYSGLMALVAHFSRAVRWRYLIQSFGFQPKLKNVFLSVLFMYFSNILIPRSGEVARCGTLYKYEKIPVKNLLGTVVVERLFDLITLMIVTMILMVNQFGFVKTIYLESSMPELLEKFNNTTAWMVVISVLIAMLMALYVMRKKLQENAIWQKVLVFKSEVIDGVKKVMALKQKVAFLGHTALIWLMYFGMTYVCFFAYEPTANLGLSAGFAIFMAGSYGMVAPTNGGIGAWHFMMITAAVAFGVAAKEAASIVNVAFAIMTGTVIIYGTIAIILLPFVNSKEKEEEIKEVVN